MARKKTATVDLKVRMKEPLRAQIERAAKDRGVSLNAEVVERLNLSFQKEDALGGRELAGLFQMIAGAVALVEAKSGESWLKDWATFSSVRTAIINILKTHVPELPDAIREAAARDIEMGGSELDDYFKEIGELGRDAAQKALVSQRGDS